MKIELEKKALEQILKQLENQQPSQQESKANKNEADTIDSMGRTRVVNSGWPPNKYRHVKGSGYGSSWTPSKNSKTQLLDQSLNGTTRVGPVSDRSRISSTSPRRNVPSGTYTALGQNEIDQQNYIINLKSMLSNLDLASVFVCSDLKNVCLCILQMT